MLEPCAGKLARTVLRGQAGRETGELPGTKTYKRDWDSCNTKQVSADRLEDFVFQNRERIAIDRHYIDSLIFVLNNKQQGDRQGLELTVDSPKLSGDIFQQTLQSFISVIKQRK